MSAKRAQNGNSHGSLPAKRVKFDGRHATMLAGEETYDPIEDDIGTGQARKKDVKLDGYGSDSSDEGHGVKRTINLDNETGPMDEDDDMFAEPPSAQADLDVRDADKKKKETFVELQDIEGQDFGTRRDFMDIVDEAGGDQDNDEEEDDDDEIDEEVGALGRKKNAPRLDSFNLRAEMEEGKFDTEGNYIRTSRDQKDNQDDWLKDVSRKDIMNAQAAVERRAQEEAAREERDRDELTVAELLAELVSYLDRGETLLEALARLGGSAQSGPRTKRKAKAQSGKSAESANVKAVERMTELANKLMAKSQIDVYDTEREGLTRAYKRETGVDLPSTSKKSDAVMHDTEDAWEFVWPGAEDTINGPYDSETMRSWFDDGLLATDKSLAQVRRVGEIVFVEANAHLFNAGP